MTPTPTNRAMVAVSLDPLTTWLAVSAGASEGHPMWESLIVLHGLVPAMLLRLLVGWVAVLGVARAVESRLPMSRRVLDAITVCFVAVSAWNLLMWGTA